VNGGKWMLVKFKFLLIVVVVACSWGLELPATFNAFLNRCCCYFTSLLCSLSQPVVIALMLQKRATSVEQERIFVDKNAKKMKKLSIKIPFLQIVKAFNIELKF
jgi:hypothetical protein